MYSGAAQVLWKLLIAVFLLLAGCIVIVKRMRMVVRWMDVVVIIISDYGHCTLNAVTASALDWGLLMVRCPEASLSRCCSRLQAPGVSGLRCRMQQRCGAEMLGCNPMIDATQSATRPPNIFINKCNKYWTFSDPPAVSFLSNGM